MTEISEPFSPYRNELAFKLARLLGLFWVLLENAGG